MKYIAKSQAHKISNSQAVDVDEYLMEDPDINGAVATIKGRYPDTGFVVNEECKELLHVISGSGKLVTKDKSVELSPGDQALIAKGEPFRYENTANLVVLAACSPPWTPEQHKEVKD